MTEPSFSSPLEPGAIAPKDPPPLNSRAPRPQAIRLRKPMVQGLVLGGAILLSGSLVWAFFIQPELRDRARLRSAEAVQEADPGGVRPSDLVADQPDRYDRLPEPRIGDDNADPATTTASGEASSGGATSYRPVYRSSSVSRVQGPGTRALAVRSALFFENSAGRPAIRDVAAPTQASDRGGRNVDLQGVYNPHGLVAPISPFELKAGALVPAVLLTAVDTSRAGPVVATVTQNVYDTVAGRYLLLPQGTRLIGRAEGESAYGDRRAFLVWERLILPNGKSLILGGEAGVDAQGAVGVRGRADRRIVPLMVGTLFAGAITTLGQMARDGEAGGSSGFLGDAGDAAAIEAARIGGRLVDRELEVRPSIRLEAGTPVRMMITRDLILERYAP